MSERIEKLKKSAEKDEQHIQKLQEGVRLKREKIKELENAEILNNLNSLSAQGYPIDKIIAAIGERDADELLRLISDKESTEESGTSSASIKNEEEKGNEQLV